MNAGSNTVFTCSDGTTSKNAAPVVFPIGKWIAVIGAIDRGAQQIILGWRTLDNLSGDATGPTSISTVGNIVGGQGLMVGAFITSNAYPITTAYLAIGSTSGSAAGVFTNITTILKNFVKALTF
jgi:hypothetical protein